MFVTTNKDELRGKVVSQNCLTMWIALPDGHIIKRHKRKHKVMYVPA